MDEPPSDNISFDDPEFWRVIDDTCNIMISESDRGALLIGASVVEESLGTLIEAVLPSNMNRKSRDKLLKYPGLLSNFSARADLAFATRLIGKEHYDAIQALRKLRNDVAHNPRSFELGAHQDEMSTICGVFENLDKLLDVMSKSLTLEIIVNRVLERDREEAYESGFPDRDAVIKAISSNPKRIDALHENALRVRLCFGVAFICLLNLHRAKKIRDALPGDQIIGRPAARVSDPPT